jgi:hypothetical protein
LSARIHFEYFDPLYFDPDFDPPENSLWCGTCGRRRPRCREMPNAAMTSDVLQVTCEACRKHPTCRGKLLLLIPLVQEHIAVLLDWMTDHPEDLPHMAVQRARTARLRRERLFGYGARGHRGKDSAVYPLLHLLAQWRFPVEDLVADPQAALKALVAARQTLARCGWQTCRAAVLGLAPPARDQT